MSVPAKRRASSESARRRSHLALKKVVLNKCPQCGKAVKPHKACLFCGTYKGKEVIKINTKETKSAK